MRTVRVLTNETCNHRCSFCDTRRPHERASVAGAAALTAALTQARVFAEVVLTGGEPSLRGDLPAIVAAAGRSGAKVVLETNGVGIDDARAYALANAGLAIARLHVPAIERHAAVTGDAEGLGRLRTAASALQRAGVVVEAAVPIAAATLPELGGLAQAIRTQLPAVTRLWARVVMRSPDDGAVAEAPDAIAGLEALAEDARRAAMPLQLDPSGFVPPCLLRRPDRLAHAYALGPGQPARDHERRIAACASCAIADRCVGVPAPWRSHAEQHARPIADERLRRRLSQVESVERQIARELVTDELWRRSDGRTVAARIVRIGFACNQACAFCFVSTHLPAAPRDAVAAAIDDIAGRGGVLVLSGGEPTLDPGLLDWVRRGKAGGALEVELQSNATRIDDALAQALVDAGLDSAFISLHGASADTSDAVTVAPGTFAATCAGLDALARLHDRLRLRINFVVCRRNHHEFPAFVALVHARWPHAAITVSFVAPSTDLVPRTPAMVPRYAEIMPALREGLDRARALGLEVGGFDSMCGIPLCLLPPGELARYPDGGRGLAELPAGIDGGEFVKPDACRRCVLERRCFGLRRGYAELHGTDELVPIDADA
ncbi:MAG: radical SAM protein [Deltaproteobacteria bacterium]|nr:radical SAM protein [Deltaproteobacteria bacterium]